MKIRFRLGLVAGLLPGGGSHGGYGLRTGPDDPVEGGHFSRGASRASSGAGGKTTGVAVRRRRLDVDPGELIAKGWDQLHHQLDAYLDAGLTKFVIRPADEKLLEEFIDRFVAELVSRQN